jgi:hypothetical protein
MKLIKSYYHDLVLLGARKYVHASTQTYALIEASSYWDLGQIDHITGNFHSKIYKKGRYDLLKSTGEKNLTKKGYCTIYQIICNDNLFMIGLKPQSEIVNTSIEYNESNLIVNHKIDTDNNLALLKINKNYIINKIIALNKELHLQLFKEKSLTNWYCSKFDLNWKMIDQFENGLLVINMIRDMRSLYTKSLITLQGEELGYIYFSRS